MDDPGRVRRGERLGDLDGVPQRVLDREAALREHAVERHPLHALHGDEVHGLAALERRAVDVVDRDELG